jgi:hypothetical protein
MHVNACCLLPCADGLKGASLFLNVVCIAGSLNLKVPAVLPVQQACPEFTTTPHAYPEALALNATAYSALVSPMVFTSSANCSNLPGYGWAHGVASECPEGNYIKHELAESADSCSRFALCCRP